MRHNVIALCTHLVHALDIHNGVNDALRRQKLPWMKFPWFPESF